MSFLRVGKFVEARDTWFCSDYGRRHSLKIVVVIPQPLNTRSIPSDSNTPFTSPAPPRRHRHFRHHWTALFHQDSCTQKTSILLGAVLKLIGAGEIKANPNISYQNIGKFLNQAEYDPSVSIKLLEDWKAKLINELNIHSRKFEYASLYSEMVKECLASSTTRSKLPLLIDFEFETVTDADMLSERMKWESLAFDPFLTDTDALGSYLGKLFSATPAITGAFAKLKEATAAFEKTMVGSNHFNETSLGWVIDGLLRSDLLTEAKRKVLKDFQGSKVVLAEIADVLNMRMLSLEKWQWDTNGAPIEQRKLLNGRSRFFHDDELLQAILLRYIGVKWSVFLKKALGDFQSAPNVWKVSISNF